MVKPSLNVIGRATARVVRDQGGMALPLALLVMVVLVSLTMALLALAGTEPQIAINHRNHDQAFYLADAGIGRALWALSNPAAPAGIPALTAIPPAYNSPLPHGPGATFFPLGVGGYTLTVVQVGATTQANVTSTGWNPNIPNVTGTTIITATLETFNGRFNLPAALMARGQASFNGNSLANGTTSTCGPKYGVMSLGTTTVQGAAATAGTPTGTAQNQPDSAFASFQLTPGEIAMLKAAAQANNTYFKGTVKFGSGSNTLSNGVVFVDTVSGGPITNPPNTSDLANVTINGASSVGWLIVMGSININGNVTMTGLVYAADQFSYRGTGGGGIFGGVVSHNVSNPVASVIDTSQTGNSNISYNCAALQPPPNLQGYLLVPGTWREISG